MIQYDIAGCQWRQDYSSGQLIIKLVETWVGGDSMSTKLEHTQTLPDMKLSHQDQGLKDEIIGIMRRCCRKLTAFCKSFTNF